MNKIPNKKDSTSNRIKLMVVLITCILLFLIVFQGVKTYNENHETISYDFSKDESIYNQTGEIWISKISIPETVLFGESFVGYVEIMSNNISDQTVFLRSRALVFIPSLSVFFCESYIIEVPSNETITVEMRYSVDPRYYSFIENSTIPTSIEIYQDEFCQNITEGRLYLSRAPFDLNVIKSPYTNPLILASVILVMGVISLKIIDHKFKKKPVECAPSEVLESDKSS